MPIAGRIETERLVLRRPESRDADAIFTWSSDRVATRLMSWPRHLSLAATREFLEFSDAEWEERHAGPYVIELAATGRLIGSCGYMLRPEGVAEAGYILASDYWRQGFATEALVAQLDAAEVIAPLRVIAAVHQDNTASLRVLEKCGFVPDDPPQTRAAFPNLGRSGLEPAVRMFRQLG